MIDWKFYDVNIIFFRTNDFEIVLIISRELTIICIPLAKSCEGIQMKNIEQRHSSGVSIKYWSYPIY